MMVASAGGPRWPAVPPLARRSPRASESPVSRRHFCFTELFARRQSCPRVSAQRGTVYNGLWSVLIRSRLSPLKGNAGEENKEAKIEAKMRTRAKEAERPSEKKKDQKKKRHKHEPGYSADCPFLLFEYSV
jgi:hypothetical protein